MIIGAPDTGKSTFARFLLQRLAAAGQRPAYLDGDPGQSSLGPPATITGALAGPEGGFPRAGFLRRWFVGATSPIRHMLPLLTGTARLAESLRRAGAGVVILDPSGFIDPGRGGCTLKWAKIDLLRPATVFAIQRLTELEPLLAPLRRRSLRLVELSPSPEIRRRDAARRREHRRCKFRAHFGAARDRELGLSGLAVYPEPAALQPGRLASLEDEDGYTMALGIPGRGDHAAGRIVLRTPAVSLAGVKILRVGDLLVDPSDFSDRLCR